MKKMGFSDVMNVVNNYAANNAATRMGHNIVCVVSLKDNRVYASGRHLIGHTAKVTMVNHCTFPKYDSKVAAITGMSITPNPLNGMTWVNYPYIKRANKSGYNYLNIYFGLGDTRMKTTTKWLMDGREATPQEVAEIERHLKPNKSNNAVSAVMYQIDPLNSWDGFFYFGESKDDATNIFDEIGK
jgi:hypothetical protein